MGIFRQAITDPSTGEASASRIGLLMMNVVAAVAAFLMLAWSVNPTILVTGVAATDAGVYAANTWGRFRVEKEEAKIVERTEARVAKAEERAEVRAEEKASGTTA